MHLKEPPRFSIFLNGKTYAIKIRLTLRFNSIGQFWAMDVFESVNQKQICRGHAIACGVPLLARTTQPYFFYLDDESGAELDPMSMEDLGTRCFLYIGEKAS
ncbi:TPA: hypothetical protein ACPPHQ_000071 [Haemophilus influenzae]|uniref:phage baseplate plug family protein n=1 Tax=Haemophilus influenzae TaxID=727 RepID=UPI000E59796F|nr:hypothetical protein [Haemophilus influenzae]